MWPRRRFQRLGRILGCASCAREASVPQQEVDLQTVLEHKSAEHCSNSAHRARTKNNRDQIPTQTFARNHDLKSKWWIALGTTSWQVSEPPRHFRRGAFSLSPGASPGVIPQFSPIVFGSPGFETVFRRSGWPLGLAAPKLRNSR